MLIDHEVKPIEGRLPANRQTPPHAGLRVAIVSDFLEEQWPSMDLVADMLTESFAGQSELGVVPTQIRPRMRRRFTETPVFGKKRAALNGDRMLNRFVDYPVCLRRQRQGFDLFHVVDHSYSQLIHSLPGERTVVTCHDLDTFGCLLDPPRERRSRWFRAMTRKILTGFRQAAHVIAVSQATRDQLLHYGLCAPERISVIPNGVHPSCSPLPDREADAKAAALMDQGNGETVWLLSVGSTHPRKRLDVLLKVFAEVHGRLPETRLVRVGGFTPAQMELIRKLNIESAVLNLAFLERDVLAALYRRAALLVHTAEAEGFGLPLIEAMACGCPVVASDLPVLREVAGPAACYCPLEDLAAWSGTMMRLLAEKLQRPVDWQMRRQQGITWTHRYSWAQNARQTASIYQLVMEKTQ